MNMRLMQIEYNYNSNFRKAVDDYCRNNECTKEEVFNSEQIKRMFWRYTDM